MRKFIVRADDKRIEPVAGIQPLQLGSSRFFLGGLCRNGRGTRRHLRLARALELDRSHSWRLLQHSLFHNREVIALDKKLVDRIRNRKRQDIVRHRGDLDAGKPALKSIRTHALPDAFRNSCPEGGI